VVEEGHATSHEPVQRAPGFFAVTIQGHFDLSPNWHHEQGVRQLVQQYYLVLRSVLHAKPGLRPCLTRCLQCRIFFLTHPRNRRRTDLRCPFGCRVAHRRHHSVERSAAYYHTSEGKMKKKRHNGNRTPQAPAPADTAPPAQSAPLNLDQAEFDPGMVKHLRVATSLIEGRKVTRQEIVEMLRRTVRQHGMAEEQGTEYGEDRVKRPPP